MARKRMLDPAIWTNEQFGSLTPFQQLLYIGLISIADDEGRLKGSSPYLKAALFPYGSVRETDISSGIARLKETTLIRVYSVDGTVYITHPNWKRWQRIDRPRASTIPPPDGFAEPSPSPRRGIAEPSPPIERKGTEGKGKKTLCPECKGTGEIGKLGYQRRCPLCKGNKLVWREDAVALHG